MVGLLRFLRIGKLLSLEKFAHKEKKLFYRRERVDIALLG